MPPRRGHSGVLGADVDRVGGQLIFPRTASVYYRRRTLAPVRPFPQGLELIAGNSKATAPQGLTDHVLELRADRGDPAAGDDPDVPRRDPQGLALHVQFPSCWDGENLDSPTTRATWPTPTRGRCPADHPVAVPALQVNVRYPSAGGAGLVLASGGQYSGHADFFNAWDQSVLAQLVDGCLNALRHCQQGS